MKYIGLITRYDWYNERGIIGYKKERLFNINFYKEDILGKSRFEEGDLVCFEKIKANNYKYKATKVYKLSQENNINNIKTYMNSEYKANILLNSEFNRIIKIYLQNSNLEETESLFSKRIKYLTYRRLKELIGMIEEKNYLKSPYIQSLLIIEDDEEYKIKCINKIINKNDLPQEEIENLINIIISSIEKNDRFDKWEKLDDKLIMKESIWRMYPLQYKYKYIMNILEKNINVYGGQILEKIKDIFGLLDFNKRKEIAKRLKIEDKLNREIYLYLSYKDQIEALNYIFEDNKIDINNYKKELIEVIKNVDDKNIILNIPTELKFDKYIFTKLNYKEQVELLWNRNNFIKIYWSLLNLESKISYIFRSSKEGRECLYLLEYESDELIISLIELTNKKLTKIDKTKMFSKFHAILQDRIIDTAWDLDKKIYLNPLFPECNQGKVDYCEGKAWGEYYAFCPRANCGCDYDLYTGARIMANIDADWRHWTLLEFIEVCNIDINIINLFNKYEYVPKMCGWVNRINEIRERLRCSCGRTLISNKKYSKNLAAYNATVFNCKEEGNHDKNVYISHCWACREIIDSRENKQKYNNEMYLCLECGSGPIKSNDFTQGDICPKCGTRDMAYISDKYRKCINMECEHEIRIPPTHKITGPKKNTNI